MSLIEVDYRFPSGIEPTKQAEIIAIGQTAGTWDERFSHRQEFLRSHLAHVKNVEHHNDYSQATVCFPLANVEGDIPSLLTMIFGKYSMAGPAKITAVRLPESYGLFPKFGIRGIRSHLGVSDRPLLMGIFKPALGLSADDYAAILREVAVAGIDIIKDDEIMGNLATAPTLERLRTCRQVLKSVENNTGKKVLFAMNVTGNVDRKSDPVATAKILVEEGANALLLNVLSYGFATLEAIAANPAINVPIFAHPALAGAWCGSPDHGFSYSALLGTLMAHAGADAVLYPAHYGSLPFNKTDEMEIKDILRSRNVFPVPSAGIVASLVPKILTDYGNQVILNAGTGIMDHPQGQGAGVEAFLQVLGRK